MDFQAPSYREAFTKILPFDKIFNPNLVTGLAESQINPEVQRAYRPQFKNLQQGLYRTGLNRTGRADVERQNLADVTERSRKEQVQGLSDTLSGYLNNWYTGQMERYGKNPSAYVMPSLPTFDQFLGNNQGLSNLYNQITNVQTGYKNPFTF